jgi:hypothetical protein
MNITLKFADKELQCSLGLMFLGELLDELDMSIEEVGDKMQKNPFRVLPKMIYTSAKVRAELSGESFEMTLGEVVEVIEKDGGIASKEVTRFVEEFVKSMNPGLPDEPAEEGGEEAKK